VPNGRRGYHELAAQLMGGKMSYPTFVFLTKERQVLTSVPGYKDQKQMLPMLEFCNNYDPIENPTDYQTFMKGYKSPYEEE
jgi:thioredoxin-related protein